MARFLPLLVSLALLGLFEAGLLVANIAHLPDMVAAPLGELARDLSGDPSADNPLDDAFQGARAGWCAVSLGLATALSWALGMAWLPLTRALAVKANNAPRFYEVMRHRDVVWISDTPVHGLAYVLALCVYPVWLLLPGLHQVLGRAILPVSDHFIEGAPMDYLFALPLVVGWVLASRRAGAVDAQGPAAA